MDLHPSVHPYWQCTEEADYVHGSFLLHLGVLATNIGIPDGKKVTYGDSLETPQQNVGDMEAGLQHVSYSPWLHLGIGDTTCGILVDIGDTM